MRSVLLGLWCVLASGSVAAAPLEFAQTFAPSLCWGACAARLGAPRALQPTLGAPRAQQTRARDCAAMASQSSEGGSSDGSGSADDE